MSEAGNNNERRPGKGLLGWLGRQVGYVRRAVHEDIGGPKVVYREKEVAEVQHPTQPEVTLRRTVVDEVIVDGRATPSQQNAVKTPPQGDEQRA